MKKSAIRSEPSADEGGRDLRAAAGSREAPVQERAVAGADQGDDARFDRLFRPTTLDEYVGQTHHKENLRVFIEAARKRNEPLDHILFCGPPGLGKTTLAYIIAKEMGVTLHVTPRPATGHKGALAGPRPHLPPPHGLVIV